MSALRTPVARTFGESHPLAIGHSMMAISVVIEIITTYVHRKLGTLPRWNKLERSGRCNRIIGTASNILVLVSRCVRGGSRMCPSPQSVLLRSSHTTTDPSSDARTPPYYHASSTTDQPTNHSRHCVLCARHKRHDLSHPLGGGIFVRIAKVYRVSEESWTGGVRAGHRKWVFRSAVREWGEEGAVWRVSREGEDGGGLTESMAIDHGQVLL